MKTALFIPSFPTFSETFILNQITGLLDRGQEITIFARSPGRGEIVHEAVTTYKLIDRTYYFGVNYQKIPSNKIIKYGNALRLLVKCIPNSPMPLVRTLNIRRYGRKAARLSLFYQVYRLHQANLQKYDIIHAHFGEMGEYAAFLKKIGLTRAKIITTFYGWDISKYIKVYGKEVYKNLFTYGDKFLCLSNEMKERVISLGCPADKTQVHHLGVDFNTFKHVKGNNKRNGKIRLLTVGRFVEKKGIEYAIEAVANLAEKYPDIEYNIVGDGPLLAKYQEMIKDLRVGHIVKFLGPKKQADVVKELAQSDIFLAPSVTAESGDQEGTPTVLIEAHALGLPVLSTLHSGIPEVVIDTKSGYLVPERNPEALTERLKMLIDNPAMRETMGDVGRKHIDNQFNIDTLNDELVELYNSTKD